MNHPKFNVSLLIILFIFLFSSHASALLSENDKQLNKHIKTFTPIYSNTKRIPWDYWGKKFEFILSLVNDQNSSPQPPSDLSHEFLGYKNKNTKLNILCNKLDPISDRLISSQIIKTLDIDDSSQSFTFLVNDLGPQKKIEISISIARDMHNIEVLQSRTRTNLKPFRTCKPTRIFNISFDVKNAPESDTISAFSKDSICYNLK